MIFKEYLDFLNRTLINNPHMGEQKVFLENGGEARGVGLGASHGGITLTSDYYVSHEVDSNLNYFTSILNLAEFEVISSYELVNQYWPPSYLLVRAENPWWLFKTKEGLIKIGWRKRVIEISWDFIDCIVTQDEVTKESQLVHAYSAEKAIEYLKTLKQLQNDPR